MASALSNSIEPTIVAAGAGLSWFSAQAPDIDHPGSSAGRLLNRFAPGLPEWLEQRLGHRGMTHWGITGLTIGFLASIGFYVLSPTLVWLGVAIGMGWFTHSLGDCLTNSGVQLLAPFSRHMVRPRDGWRFPTGGSIETMVIHPLMISLAATAGCAYLFTLAT